MCIYRGTLLMILFPFLPKSMQLSQSREWGGHKNHLENGKDSYSLSNLKIQIIPVISCFSGSPERLRRQPNHPYILHTLYDSTIQAHTLVLTIFWQPIAPALGRHAISLGHELFTSWDYGAIGWFRMELKITHLPSKLSISFQTEFTC